MSKINKTSNGQNGFVSLVVALTLITILALMTVGFSQLSRHEQQQSLDKQLAVQAGYAAETGINDAARAVLADPAAFRLAHPNSKTQCTKINAPPSSDKSVIDLVAAVSYPCILVDTQAPSLEKSRLPSNKAWNITFTTSAPPASLFISWGNEDPAKRTVSPTVGAFGTQPGSDDSPGTLQVSITPYDATFIKRAELITRTFNSILYPSSRSSLADIGIYNASIGDLPTNGPILSGACNPGGALPRSTNFPCSVEFINLNDPTDSFGSGPGAYTGPYLIHILDYYQPSNISITAVDILGRPVEFIGGQVMIDSTGKARDVLKRMRVRISLNRNSLELPNYALEARDICKRMLVAQSPAPTTFSKPSGYLDDACDPSINP